MEGNADPMSTAAVRQCTGARVSSCTSRIVKDMGVEQLSHPPYSTDLAPSDLYPFLHLKKHLRRKWFCGDDDNRGQAGNRVLSQQHASRILFDWNKGPF